MTGLWRILLRMKANYADKREKKLQSNDVLPRTPNQVCPRNQHQFQIASPPVFHTSNDRKKNPLQMLVFQI